MTSTRLEYPQSTVKLFRDDKLIAEWQEGRCPDPSFYDVMSTDVKRCDITRSEGGDRIEFEFDNGLIMHLAEDPVPFESMQITIDGKMWIIWKLSRTIGVTGTPGTGRVGSGRRSAVILGALGK